MPHVTANGLELFYEDHEARGEEKTGETILLVMGLGAQLTLWPDELVEALARRGYRVIRYDNRDIGLSQKLTGKQAPGMKTQVVRQKLGVPAKVPYTLRDMADDAIGLLDALGIERAHVVGASMGGMIAQLMAVHHAARLLTLTSIMSTTGNPALPEAEKQAMDALTAPVPSMREDDLVDHWVRMQQAIGSPGYRADPDRQRERAREGIRRSTYPAGFARQLAAIIDDGDRRERLARITTPTLVLHGEDDPLVRREAGEDTAAHIPGAKLVTIPGWGHDLPLELVDRIADEIADHARAARA